MSQTQTSPPVHAASLLMSNAVPLLPADPEDEYQVEWLADGHSAVLKRSDVVRTAMPLTRAVIKSWLPFAAETETVQVWYLRLAGQPWQCKNLIRVQSMPMAEQSPGRSA